jgi:hypothetical protein
VHRLDDADANRMMDHQPRKQFAINQDDLVFVTLCKFLSGHCEVRSGHEDALGRLVRAKAPAKVSNLRFTDGVVRGIFFLPGYKSGRVRADLGL